MADRTFRLFVSSTFEDLKLERDALEALVWPRIDARCRSRGARFQAIDLRWGVSRDAAMNHKTLPICLAEIERCQQVTPRPNFLVLLGQRYGWRPPPPMIPAGEFEAILTATAGPEDRQLIEAWYRRDDNAVPPEYLLRPRGSKPERLAEQGDIGTWDETERLLTQALRGSARRVGLPGTALAKFECSATELEVRRGALGSAATRRQALCFVRDIVGLPDQAELAQPFVDVAGDDFDDEARTRSKALRSRLARDLEAKNVHWYEARWDGHGLSPDHLAPLCAAVEQAVWSLIEPELEKASDQSQLEAEVSSHRDFARERSACFTGRSDLLGVIDQRLNVEPLGHPLAIVGAAGSGKSALMAEVAGRGAKAGVQVIQRFVGSTAGSRDLQQLLIGLCAELADLEGTPDPPPTTVRGATERFRNLIGHGIGARGRLVVIDAIDQLSVRHANDLRWIPGDLPTGVNLVVSCADDAENTVRALRSRLGTGQVLDVPTMADQEASELLDRWLDGAQRTLTKPQRARVLRAFADVRLPLYLRLAFEEARRWHSFEEGTDLALGVEELVEQNLFPRLAGRDAHGPTLVTRAMGHLAAARNGLGEDELLALLSADEDVLEEVATLTPSSTRVDRLPIVLWSRLFFDLEPYLAEREVDGVSALVFFHRQVREAAQSSFLRGTDETSRHQQLAQWFSQQADPTVGHTTQMSRRSLAELPYHLARAGLWAEATETLTDLRFIAAKCERVDQFVDDDGSVRHYGVHRLQEDLDLVLRLLTAEEQTSRQDLGPKATSTVASNESRLEVLQAFRRAIGLEAHNLARWPELTRQQLHNRLSSRNLAVVARLEESAPGPGDPAGQRVWARAVRPSGEPAALEMTISAHEPNVASCALTSDARYLVTAGGDRLGRVWDLETGAEVSTLEGHTEAITSCCIGRGDRQAITTSQDGSARAWDIGTGELIWVAPAHRGWATSCARLPDGRSLVTAGSDGYLRVWDAASGARLHQMTMKVTVSFDLPDDTSSELSFKLPPVEVTPSSDFFGICSVHPDGRYVAAGTPRGAIVRWRPGEARGTTGATLHERPVSGLSFHPGGRWLASASHDGSVAVWDEQLGDLAVRLSTRHERANSCAFSPDGQLLAAVDGGGWIYTWNVGSWHLSSQVHGHAQEAQTCQFDAGGQRLVTGCYGGLAKVWDVEHLSESEEPASHSDVITDCTFTPDGRLLVTASRDSTVKLWDPDDAGSLRRSMQGGGPLETCDVSPDGSWLTGGGRQGLTIWELDSGHVRDLISSGHWMETCAVSPDGSSIVVGDQNVLRLWDVSSGTLLRSFHGHSDITRKQLRPKSPLDRLTRSEVTSIAFAPDGTWLLSASADGTIRAWWLETAETWFRATGHRPFATACAISPDGSWAVSGDSSGDLRRWGIGSLTADSSVEDILQAQVFAHSSGVNDCAITPDGRFVATVGGDGTARIWDATTFDPVALIPMFGEVHSLAVHPWRPLLAAGDGAGSLSLFELEELRFGPLFVTATHQSNGALSFTCTRCGHANGARDEDLGHPVSCANADCAQQFKLNPFVIKPRAVSTHDTEVFEPEPTRNWRPWRRRRRDESAPG